MDSVAARAICGAFLLVMLVHAVETTKFVAAWTDYKAAVRALARGAASDPKLGDSHFVSSTRISADLNRFPGIRRHPSCRCCWRQDLRRRGSWSIPRRTISGFLAKQPRRTLRPIVLFRRRPAGSYAFMPASIDSEWAPAGVSSCPDPARRIRRGDADTRRRRPRLDA